MDKVPVISGVELMERVRLWRDKIINADDIQAVEPPKDTIHAACFMFASGPPLAYTKAQKRVRDGLVFDMHMVSALAFHIGRATKEFEDYFDKEACEVVSHGIPKSDLFKISTTTYKRMYQYLDSEIGRYEGQPAEEKLTNIVAGMQEMTDNEKIYNALATIPLIGSKKMQGLELPLPLILKMCQLCNHTASLYGMSAILNIGRPVFEDDIIDIRKKKATDADPDEEAQEA